MGDVILDLYEVEALLGEGGMGRVWRVHHRGWGVDLAVKEPRADALLKPDGAAAFVREAETWVSLGLHPQLVSCHYVRTLGGIPRVFAEYVDGGSLGDWIRTGRLHEGGARAALARVLDAAIQSAWGLAHAHERGLVHQDVKPANIMMTADGIAKVTDFGLARATPVVTVARPGSSDVSVGGMTPAYASPEQARGERLTTASDVWSWGASVLEMVTGEVSWRAGPLAGEAFRSWLDDPPPDRPRIRAEFADVLEASFALDPARRPTLREAAAGLAGAYEAEVGQPYPRRPPQPSGLTADALNNRGLTYLDLGRAAEADAAWREALVTDPSHPETIFNSTVRAWRRGRLTDREALARVRALQAGARVAGRAELLEALVHAERWDWGNARQSVEAARRAGEDAGSLGIAERLLPSAGAAWRRTAALEPPPKRLRLSADGRWALVDGSVWDLAADRRIWTAPEGALVSVSLAERLTAGLRALTAEGARLRLWDVMAGRCLLDVNDHEDGQLQDPFDGLPGDLWNEAEVYAIGQGYGAEPSPYRARVTGVSLARDGRRAVTVGADRYARLWDLEAGRCLEKWWPCHHAVATAGEAHVGTEWDRLKRLQMGVHPQTPHDSGIVERRTAPIDGLWVDAAGRHAVSAHRSGQLLVWDAVAGRVVRSLAVPGPPAFDVHASDDCRWAVTLSRDGERLVGGLWDLHAGRCLRSDAPPLSISGDGLRLAVVGERVEVWETEALGGVRAPGMLSRPASGSEVAAVEQRARDGLARARRALDERRHAEVLGILTEVESLPGCRRSPEVREAWAGLTQRARRTGVRDAWLERRLALALARTRRDDRHNRHVRQVATCGEGRWCAVVSAWETFSSLDLSGAEAGVEIDGLPNPLFDVTTAMRLEQCDHVALCRDGRRALTSAGDQIRVWDMTRARQSRAQHRDRGALERLDHWTRFGRQLSGRRAALSPDGHWVATADQGILRLYAAGASERPERTWPLKSWPESVHFGPGASWVMVASASGWTLVDLVSGRRATVEREHDASERAFKVMRLCHGGRRLLARGERALNPSHTATAPFLRFYEVASGRLVRQLDVAPGVDDGVELTADGRFLFTSRDDDVLVAPLETGRVERTLAGLGRVVGLSRDGLRLLVDHEDRIDTWRLEWSLECPPAAAWDRGADSIVEEFLTELAQAGKQRTPGPGRRPQPVWDAGELAELMLRLGGAGFGWLDPGGVDHELRRRAAHWTGSPSFPRP